MDFWPIGGIKLKSLDLLPRNYREQHLAKLQREHQNPARLAETCARICRSQILAYVFSDTAEIYRQLHQELFMWFIQVVSVTVRATFVLFKT